MRGMAQYFTFARSLLLLHNWRGTSQQNLEVGTPAAPSSRMAWATRVAWRLLAVITELDPAWVRYLGEGAA